GADPGVTHSDLERPAFGGRRATTLESSPARGKLDLAALGELDRVREQVDDDLAEPPLVADDRPRHLLVDRVHELEMLRRGVWREDVDRPFDATAEVEWLLVELDSA